MDYTKQTLSNGLRIITVPFPNMSSATITVWVNTGSRNEETNFGISHFLEHMVFKGSSRRPTAKEIAEAVDSIGGEFNAGTSKEYTNFYIKARPEVLDTAMDVLSDMVLDPMLRQDDIDREKGVILEEMSMYEDTPTAHIGDIFERLIFDGHNLGRDIIGTRDAIKAMTKADFQKYRNKFYFAHNMLVTISGNITVAQSKKLVQKYFGHVKSSSKQIATKYFKEDQKMPKVLLDSQKKEQGHFILGFLGNKKGEDDRYVQSVMTTILGGGMSSRLFTEIREKRGLAYSLRSGVDHYIDTGYIETYAGVQVGKIDEAIKVILDETYKLRDGINKISKVELSKAKEYLKGHLALSLEDTRKVNYFVGEEELSLGKVRTPDEIFKAVDKVSVDDILDSAKKFLVPERLNLAIIGPYKDKARFEKLIK